MVKVKRKLIPPWHKAAITSVASVAATGRRGGCHHPVISATACPENIDRYYREIIAERHPTPPVSATECRRGRALTAGQSARCFSKNVQSASAYSAPPVSQTLVCSAPSTKSICFGSCAASNNF